MSTTETAHLSRTQVVMPSLIAWLDASSEEQRRMRDIVRLFADCENRDELGLDQVRDAIADALFLGRWRVAARF